MNKTNPPFQAVVFDMDGVITKTAVVHARAWQEMFNLFLKFHAEKYNITFESFTYERDYLTYIDGKPRYEGVKSFLESRNIDLPFGTIEDQPSFETVCSLGNMKNDTFIEILNRDGINVYESTVKLIHELLDCNIHVGVATSSKNCPFILKTVGLENTFETRVDGNVSAELGLNGKPEPDIFLTATKNMNCAIEKTIVVEDAVSGVQAGQKGNFGLVIGVARENNEDDLSKNGADVVINDFEGIDVKKISEWFLKNVK